MSETAKWPRYGGASLAMVVHGEVHGSLELLTRALLSLGDRDGVDVGRGVSHCEEVVRSGFASIPWLDPTSVFVFRCPRDLDVWEAAPLLETGLGTLAPELVVRATRFLVGCGSLGLEHAERVAFVAALTWEPGDHVRCASGDAQQFREYIAQTSAWCATFLGSGAEYVVQNNDELPFWFELRPAVIETQL